ncbi:ATP/GTP-binding protein [Streptomyces spiroverticillatus]|uniref:ATP/GTP-binding protein n=1 Tax=Streptomyces finlayi TaxID=67296 RepID=A0A918X7V0_9ACTN|nr:ATP-binding protein [Streptomyces finlayi]GHA45916.1 ATP/GTP-binding protein [Streptomyces spiroverticillatus]GHD15974.1 ATP/GTP-binding protein [Streptomyces finlayi]
MNLLCPQIPEHSLVVLIGPSGAGKTTLARTWPASQVLSLDALRETVSDDAGDQDATGDAVAALHLLLEARMRRRLFTVIDATNVTQTAREPLLAAARRHDMTPVAVMVTAPGTVCVERQKSRRPNRRVPDDVVLQQRRDMVASHWSLTAEGFEIVTASSLYRLTPYLRHLSETRNTDLGLDGGDGLGELLIVRRTFGDEILPLWRWQPESDAAGGDRVAEIRLGQQYLTLALRSDVDGEGDIGFDVAVPCPYDDQCTGSAWVPAYSVTCLYRALNGDLDHDEDIVCTVHGGADDVDQEADDHDRDDDPEGRADLEAQFADAVRE